MKIKVKIGNTLTGKVYMRQEGIQYGQSGKNIFTPEEVAASPEKFEIVEATQCEASILRESDNKGWQKDPSWRPRVLTAPLREDAAADLRATKTALRSRKYEPKGAGGEWSNGTTTVTIADDGSAKCCGKTFKDHTTLESHLDSTHPAAPATAESFRLRTEAAYRKMGLSLRESAEAADIEKSVLLESWTKIFGSREVAAQFLKGGAR